MTPPPDASNAVCTAVVSWSVEYVPAAIVTVRALPLTVTSIVLLPGPMTVDEATGLPVVVAPADACVISSTEVPAPRPLPARTVSMPTERVPVATDTNAAAVTAVVSVATVPIDRNPCAWARRSTVKVSDPELAVPLTDAAAMSLCDTAVLKRSNVETSASLAAASRNASRLERIFVIASEADLAASLRDCSAVSGIRSSCMSCVTMLSASNPEISMMSVSVVSVSVTLAVTVAVPTAAPSCRQAASG